MARDGGLRQLFQKNLPGGVWQAVETWSTGQGVPDAHYCFPNAAAEGPPSWSGWIEYKVTSANAVDIRPEQIAWIERYWRVNGRAWIAVRKKCAASKRRVAADELHLFHGLAGRHLFSLGLSGVPNLYKKGMWSGGPANWDWAAVKKVITA